MDIGLSSHPVTAGRRSRTKKVFQGENREVVRGAMATERGACANSGELNRQSPASQISVELSSRRAHGLTTIVCRSLGAGAFSPQTIYP